MSDHEPWQRRARRPQEPFGEQPPASSARQQVTRPPTDPPYPPASTGRRHEWSAAASFGRTLGIVLAALSILIALVALWRFRDAAGSARLAWLSIAILLALAGITIGWLVGTIGTIRYAFTEDGVSVRWRAREHLIPWPDLRDVRYEPRSPSGGWEPIWPGFHVYTRKLPNGTRRVVATQRDGRRIELVSSAEIVEISPDRPILFLAEFERERMAHGLREPAMRPLTHEMPHQPVRERDDRRDVDDRASEWPATRRVPPSADPRFGGPSTTGPTPTRRPQQDTPFVDDWRAPRPPERSRQPAEPAPFDLGSAGPFAALRHLFVERLLADQLCSTLLAVGVVLPVLMTAFLYNQYEGLPDQLPLHWDALGAVDRVGEPRDLWRLPLMAAVVLVGNGAVATLLTAVDRMLARLLLAATPVAQLVMFIALARAAS